MHCCAGFTGLPHPITAFAATSGEYPVEENANKAAKCPNAPITQFSEFAYNLRGRHPITRRLRKI
ncbi:hypothetical protein EMIT0P294_20732 [Pseudomonas sp. IT-P294]